MSRDYRLLVSQLQKRMNPDNYTDVRLFGETVNKELLGVAGNNVLEYIKRAMQGVAKVYTDRSIEAGTNVKNHLKEVLHSVDYEYQGSVMTNTHIKGNSDIDLLVLCNKFYYFNREKVEGSYASAAAALSLDYFQKIRLKAHLDSGSYQGDSIQDLKDIRIKSENKMKTTYSMCDTSKPKCIAITNQSLHRDVDIVVAAWHKTYEGIRDASSKKNSVRIYNKDSDDVGRIESPFVSIERINDKDNSVNGRLKKMIRFVKTLKYDSKKDIDLTSFEINAICYNIGTSKYSSKSFHELVPILGEEFAKILTDVSYRNSIYSVDGSEVVFLGKENKVDALGQMFLELSEILNNLKMNKLPSYVR